MKILSNTNYKGFVVQEVELQSAGESTQSRPTPHSYKRWQITKIGARPDQFSTAMSKEHAEGKIDSGDAAKDLAAKGFLTSAQKTTLLQIGKPNSPLEVVNQDAWNDLVSLGLIYKREDGRYDLTDSGEHLYDLMADTPEERRD